MKRIHLDEVLMLNNDKEQINSLLEEAEKTLMRKRSEKGIQEAYERINYLLNSKKRIEEKLRKIEKEEKEAEALLLKNDYEIILVTIWMDDDDVETKVKREKVKNLDEAKEKYTKLKKGNGGYVNITIEIREQGTQERIEKLQKEIEERQKEIADLLKG